MFKKWLTFAFLIVMLAVTAMPVSAVTGNFVKDFNHPYVGLAVFYDSAGQFLWRCSGSLLAPNVLLTAGHCVEGAYSARVYFQQDAGVNYNPATGVDPVTGYPETCADSTLGVTCATGSTLINYGYPATFPDRHDVGLVILDQNISMPYYGVLAAPGTLDSLASKRGQQDVTFTVSGYGVSYTNPTRTLSYRERLEALMKVINITSALTGGFNLQVSSGKGIGGGSCFGDSGGPVFYGGYTSNLIVGVNSFVLNGNCAGTSFAYRVDQQAVLDWILSNVPDPGAIQVQ